MERKNVLSGVLCVMFGILCSSAFAIAPVGPPTAGLKTEQWSAGFDYAQGEIDNFDIEWSTDFPVDLAALGLKKSEAKDMKSDAYLVPVAETKLCKNSCKIYTKKSLFLLLSGYRKTNKKGTGK